MDKQHATTGIPMGQAAGTAAAMAARENQGVAEIDIQQLQRQLKAGGIPLPY